MARDGSLFRDQIHLVYLNALPSTIAILLITLLCWVGFKDVLPPNLIHSWAGYMLLVAAFRFSLHRKYTRHYQPQSANSPIVWGSLMIMSAASAGLGWAAVAAFPLILEETVYQAIAVMMVLGILAATVPVLSAVMAAFYLACLPASLTLFFAVTSVYKEHALLIGTALTVYTVLVWIAALNTNKTLLRTLNLQQEKESLIEHLNKEVAKRRAAHQELQTHQSNLEKLVMDRTEKLHHSNLELEHEIAIRLRSEEELREKKQRLEHIAFHDPLTNLPNRTLLSERVQRAIVDSRRNRRYFALAYIDLDGFKEVNDAHGHETGDKVLITLGHRFSDTLRESDTVARLGGDEFVVILPNLETSNDADESVLKLLHAASQPIHVDDQMLQLSASIGVTFYPQHLDVDADQLLRQADQAMYKAKLTGKNRSQHFALEEDRFIQSQHESLEHISQALDNLEFELYYQPRVNMRLGTVVGAEALIRWQHPQRGTLLPQEFLPLVENHPLSTKIDQWVLESVVAQLSAWQRIGLDLPISVNIGAHLLQETALMPLLETCFDNYPEVPPGRLELEVLETSALQDLGQVSSIMRACTRKGIEFALDDFGTGYSSLTYLKLLPAKHLKIDRSFVRDMLDDPEDLAILEGVLGLATAFRREVIAEGVETLQHGTTLLQLGCELAQGHAIAAALPRQAFERWLDKWSPPETWANTQAIDRSELPLLVAGTEHRYWVKQITSCIEGKGPPRVALQSDECPLGQWLDSDGKQDYGNHPAYPGLCRDHHALHEIAKTHCRTTSSNPDKTFPDDAPLKKLQTLQRKILGHLDQMKRTGTCN